MPVSGIIGIPASLRSDFIHIAGMPIHIPLESTIHITGIGRMMLPPVAVTVTIDVPADRWR
jgi:hypothetical protein